MILAPPSMRAISSRVAAPPSGSTPVRVMPSATDFVTRRWWCALRGDLREVRHAEHLRALPDAPEQLPDGLGDRAADARVDLVEDQRRYRAGIAGGELQRETDARELAARGDAPEGRRGDAGVRADQEGHGVHAVGRSRLGIGRDVHDEPTALHRERLHRLGDEGAERPGVARAPGAEPLRRGEVVREARVALRLERVGRASRAGQRVELVAQALLDVGELVGRAPVLLRERVQGTELRVEPAEPGVVVLERADLAAKRARRLRRLDARRLDQIERLPQALVDRGELAKGLEGPVQRGVRVALERVQRVAAERAQPLDVRQPAVLGLDVGEGEPADVELVELLELEAEEVDPLLASARVVERLPEPRVGLVPTRVRRPHLAEQAPHPPA